MSMAWKSDRQTSSHAADCNLPTAKLGWLRGKGDGSNDIQKENKVTIKIYELYFIVIQGDKSIKMVYFF